MQDVQAAQVLETWWRGGEGGRCVQKVRAAQVLETWWRGGGRQVCAGVVGGEMYGGGTSTAGGGGCMVRAYVQGACVLANT